VFFPFWLLVQAAWLIARQSNQWADSGRTFDGVGGSAGLRNVEHIAGLPGTPAQPDPGLSIQA